VVDGAGLEDRHITEITIGFYSAGKHSPQAPGEEFSLNIGQIKVSFAPSIIHK
jgi:hypothetical protein